MAIRTIQNDGGLKGGLEKYRETPPRQGALLRRMSDSHKAERTMPFTGPKLSQALSVTLLFSLKNAKTTSYEESSSVLTTVGANVRRHILQLTAGTPPSPRPRCFSCIPPRKYFLQKRTSP
jgi:hypothetical protein